ncbi:acyl carrier protein [Sphingobacterium corticibacterium]|uniref:Acyl carrier protein n=1 Tax=Sphingobacterium corticibacterium TaxID=2484746 RepID=A0A4Q6XH71_9SPHI|nr:acyl carrier protein [Sphingobacterium corticibacterium]RZF58883.1 acyl carrier protein [Sphingobacterium corticibacterium]
MEKQEFLKNLQEVLEVEQTLTVETNLKDLDEWDSMTAMLLIGYVSDEFGVTLTGDNIGEISTVQSVIDFIGESKFS